MALQDLMNSICTVEKGLQLFLKLKVTHVPTAEFPLGLSVPITSSILLPLQPQLCFSCCSQRQVRNPLSM